MSARITAHPSWTARARRGGALALAGALAALGAVPALAAGDLSFRGRSSQGLPVAVVVSGAEIRRLTVTWQAQCPALHGPLKDITTYHEGVALTKGAWSAAGSYRAKVHGGYDEEFSVRDRGSVTGTRRVIGVFVGTVQIYRGEGRKRRRIDTCQSGKVTFTLSRSR